MAWPARPLPFPISPMSLAGRRASSVRLKAFRQSRGLVLAGRIALRAGHAGAAARACVRAFPGPVLVDFANPPAIFAQQALHVPNMSNCGPNCDPGGFLK